MTDLRRSSKGQHIAAELAERGAVSPTEIFRDWILDDLAENLLGYERASGFDMDLLWAVSPSDFPGTICCDIFPRHTAGEVVSELGSQAGFEVPFAFFEYPGKPAEYDQNEVCNTFFNGAFESGTLRAIGRGGLLLVPDLLKIKFLVNRACSSVLLAHGVVPDVAAVVVRETGKPTKWDAMLERKVVPLRG